MLFIRFSFCLLQKIFLDINGVDNSCLFGRQARIIHLFGNRQNIMPATRAEIGHRHSRPHFKIFYYFFRFYEHFYLNISLNTLSNSLSKLFNNLLCGIFNLSKTVSNLLNPPSLLSSTHSILRLVSCFLLVSESLSATNTLLFLAMTASALSGFPMPINLTSHLY